MSKVSIIIPSRGERFLPNTVADLLAHATGEVELLPVLDGYRPDPPLPEDPRVKPLFVRHPKGMRAAINAASQVATGEFLMKTDGHCLFGPGFDEILAADCADNWVVIPRRKRLDGATWTVADPDRAPIDYHYLDCPLVNKDGFQMHGVVWGPYTYPRLHLPLDETMSFQGSCWFMRRAYFQRVFYPMDEPNYGTFSQEPQEIGNKCWLGGGQVMVNKKTYYAHLHKGRTWGRGYHIGSADIKKGHDWSGHFWMENRWAERVHDFEWLVDKFWPVPTWPADWKDMWRRYQLGERFSPEQIARGE